MLHLLWVIPLIIGLLAFAYWLTPTSDPETPIERFKRNVLNRWKK